MQIAVEVPERYLIDEDVSKMAHRLKLYTALLMFQSGQVSAGGACEFADVDRYTFLAACRTHGIATINYDEDEIEAELEQLRRQVN